MRKPRTSLGSGSGSGRFLGYERAELDRQYDLLARHEDSLGAFSALGVTLSERARRLPGAVMDVPYGDRPGMTMDLYPAEQPGAPVIAFVRGGYWRLGDKRDLGLIALGLVPHGCAVAVIDHGAPPQADLAQIVEQVCRAMLWLRDNAGRLNGDGDRLIAAGQGSGSHLAALLLTADWAGLEDDENAACPVTGMAALSGLFDLEPIRLSFLNIELRLDAAAVPQLSPMRLARALPRPSPPIFLAVGQLETDEYHRQTATYAAMLEEAGACVSVLTSSGHHHFSLLVELANPSSEITKRVIDLAAPPAAADCEPI